MTSSQPLAAQARQLHLAGDAEGASALLRQLISEVTRVTAQTVTVNADQYSLNSLNGTVALANDTTYFFKFHSEEGEETTITEYYNAELLRKNGYDVDVPVYACGEPGRQILLYALRSDARLADVCRSIELGETRYDSAIVVKAQQYRDCQTLERMLATLHAPTATDVAAEPIHQLFWQRLVTPGTEPRFGGRVDKFYVGKEALLGGPEAQISLDWPTFRDAYWVINGVRYEHTVGQLFAEASTRLSPLSLADNGAVVAHGDEHNANVWFEENASSAESEVAARLVSFDPAFAGSNLPALLADIKATFHNVFAHPFWLYEPAVAAERYTAEARLEGDTIVLDHTYAPSDLRLAFRDSKAVNVWQPLIAELRVRGLLPSDWQRIVKLALFCCPTLVLDLRASGRGHQTPVTSAIGWATAIAAGSMPVDSGGVDAVTPLFEAMQPRGQ